MITKKELQERGGKSGAWDEHTHTTIYIYIYIYETDNKQELSE